MFQVIMNNFTFRLILAALSNFVLNFVICFFSDSHEDSDAEEVQSEAAQEEADSEDEAESEVPVTEKKRRKAKAPGFMEGGLLL